MLFVPFLFLAGKSALEDSLTVCCVPLEILFVSFIFESYAVRHYCGN